jgi:hypothetical protein
LYTRTFDGTALSEDEYVIPADEKTSVQAPGRGEPGSEDMTWVTRFRDAQSTRSTLDYSSAPKSQAALHSAVRPRTVRSPSWQRLRW